MNNGRTLQLPFSPLCTVGGVAVQLLPVLWQPAIFFLDITIVLQSDLSQKQAFSSGESGTLI